MLVLGIGLLVGGCAETHIFSRSNPEVALKKYSSILIIANVPGMEFQTQLEDGLSNNLNQKDTDAKGDIPAKIYERVQETFKLTPLTTDEIKQLCEKNNCDAVIFIGMDTPKSRDYNIDLGSTTQGTVTRDAFGDYTFTSRTMNQSIAGTITTFNATVDLVDVATGKIAWHSEEHVTTGGIGTWDQAINSFINTVADELTQNVWIAGRKIEMGVCK